MTLRRVFVVLDLKGDSQFDPASDIDLDELAEDALTFVHGVAGAATYASLDDLVFEEKQRDDAERRPPT